jgi:hypothetical protein
MTLPFFNRQAIGFGVRLLRLIRGVMFALGIAALMATISSWFTTEAIFGAREKWVVALETFSLKIALTFLPASICAAMLMPRLQDMTRERRDGEVHEAPTVVKILLTVLAVIALLQVPTILSWWSEDRVLLGAAFGSRSDPMGLDLIPKVMLYSMPAMAAAAIVTFVLTSILGIVARAEHTFHVLGAATSLQAGLVVGEHLIVRGLQSGGGTLARVAASSGDQTFAVQVAEWFGRHDAVSSAASWPLVWLLGGYALALVVAEVMSRRVAPVLGDTFDAGEVPAPALPMTTSAATTMPATTLAAPISAAAAAFNCSSYAVRPRSSWLDSIVGIFTEYEIETIPPMSRARFSFSWSTGILRRDPQGPDLLAVQQSKRHAFARASYVVIDLPTGATLGTIMPNRDGWEIVDPQGLPIVAVLEMPQSVGFKSYAARVGDRDVCRFTWLLTGLSVLSTQVDVEFVPGSEAVFDKAFGMALAPLVEHKARRDYQWRYSTSG